MQIAGIILALVGLAIAHWQYRDAQRAKAQLAAYLRRLPDQVLNNISGFLRGEQGEELELYDIRDAEKTYHTRVVDLDGDGEDELLVQ